MCLETYCNVCLSLFSATLFSYNLSKGREIGKGSGEGGGGEKKKQHLTCSTTFVFKLTAMFRKNKTDISENVSCKNPTDL